MCSAFRLFTLERIASRLNNGQAPRRLTFRGIVFIILYIPLEPCAPCLLYGRLAPCRAFAVIRQLVGGGSAALPCRPDVGAPCSLVRSYNNTKSGDYILKKELNQEKRLFWRNIQLANNNSRDELCNIDKYDPSIIAERIKNAAYSKNITIKEVLTAAGLSVNYVQQMQHDNRQPRLSAIARICDILNISIDALLDRATPTPTPTPPDLNMAISTVAAAADLPPDYVRGILHLPPTCSSTDNDI